MKYSLIVPIYNDGDLALEFTQTFEIEIKAILESRDIDDSCELIFVNDGSSNNSLSRLKDLSKRFAFVRVIDLSRNVGQHVAITAGYESASGEFVGMMNVDMQEHPSEYIKMLKYCESHPDVDFVLGLRQARRDQLINKFTSFCFNVLLNKLTSDTTPLNASTVRVMTRKFTNAYLELNERSRYLPGLENWLGFKHGHVEVTHVSRKKGKSSYTLRKRWEMAVNVILSFSDLPLRMAAGAGFTIAIVGFLMSIFLILQKLFLEEMQPGYTSTISIIVFLAGVQIMFIGLASLYIGRILKEVQNRPLYLINNKYNF